MNVVVENPAGPLTLGVSSDNPYKDCPVSSVNSGDTNLVYFGDTVYHLDNEDIEYALELDRRSRGVRILTAIDACVGILNFTLFGYVLSTLVCIVSYFGYHGAALYRRPLIIGYLTYQTALAATRLAMVIYVFQTHNNTEIMIIAPISLVIQIYITWYVWTFYSLLPKFGY
jgi:hypothetical protein